MIQKVILLISLFINPIGQILDAQKVYDARVDEKEILTPAPGKAPKINGPKIYGIRPGKKMIYRIPCQGERPIQFTIDNLPKGLELDSEKGIITGKIPDSVINYNLTIHAGNKYGEVSRSFKICVGEKIALTPPTGWNSWGGHMITVSDETMRHAADVFVEKGLADAGFQYIGIDDCWMRMTPEMHESRSEFVKNKHKGYDFEGDKVIGKIRDGNGNILPNGKFPDMKAMTDYIHSKGLKAGIYSGPGKQTCQRFAASYGHERADADQFAAWGFDLLKYDLCSGSAAKAGLMKNVPGFKPVDFWRPMAEYLMDQDHDIVFNLCQYGRHDPWTWAPSLNIQSWRTGGDLNHNVHTYFDQALRIATELREYSKPGQWNDPDFMYIHRIKDVHAMNEPSQEIPLTTNQRYQYVSLWSIIAAPYFFSCDINEIDEFTIGLLANEELVTINQDEKAHVAEVIRNDENETILLKKMADGSLILALFNRKADEENTLSIDWAELGLTEKVSLFDVWRQKEMGQYNRGLKVKLSPDGVGLFRLKSEM